MRLMENEKLRDALPVSSPCKWGGSSQGRQKGSVPGIGVVGWWERA